MNRIAIMLSLLLLVVAASTISVTAQVPAEKQHTFLSALKEGQSVSLREVSGRYEISSVQGVAAVHGHTVIEVAADFVVIQDVAGITETRIPVFSIKAVVRLKVPK